MKLTINQVKRFLSKVDTSKGVESCWKWKGWKTSKGYGSVKINNKKYRAHRIAYELVKGKITSELIMHKCDVRDCVNPLHLSQGTNADNMRDMSIKKRGRNGNSNKQLCINGHSLSGDNLQIRSDGKRQCVTCKKSRYWINKQLDRIFRASMAIFDHSKHPNNHNR
jgi:hypothetical protein